ncbi:MAG: lamin tail domain-containing protein [Solirubrobacteraceae bacterium]
MRFRIQLALVAVLAAAMLAPSASGSPSADLAAVILDYSRDGKITPCRFTQRQLESARSQIGEDVEAYAKGVRPAIVREVKRWRDGRCRGKRAGAAKLRIVAVQPKGGPGEESVTIQNTGRKAVDVRGYGLRDAGDHVVRLRATKLKARGRLRVVTGCRSGHKGAVRRGSSYYACRTLEVWDDAGDTVELLGPGGGLLSRKAY